MEEKGEMGIASIHSVSQVSGTFFGQKFAFGMWELHNGARAQS